MPRTLLAGQRSRILVVDAETADVRVVFESTETLVEAPNWSPDGRSLIVNADGLLWRLDLADVDARLIAVPMVGVPEINNDHCIAPDGASVFVSAKDGHIYEVPWSGGAARRVTRDHPEGRGYKNYLHGVSPDGSTLTAIVGARPTPQSAYDEWQTNVALVTVADGETTLLTDDEHPDDGAELSPDGSFVWFNTERFTADAGHAQIARVRPDGTGVERVTVDDRVDWFAHPAPDASRLVFVSYAPGTEGHPENHDVMLCTIDLDGGDPVPGSRRDLLPLFGGQGTINVPGWSPESRLFACCDYPLG